MLLGFVVNLSENPFEIGDLVAAVLFVAAPMAIGTALVRSHYKARQKALEADKHEQYRMLEKQVIRLAQKHNGRLTIPEIAVDTTMSTQEAEKFMEDMASKGYVDMQVSDSGVIVYEFYEIAQQQKLAE